MSFFQRKRAELESLGIDVSRLPPGQYHTKRFPVLQAGGVPRIDFASWKFTVDGLVDRPTTWNLDEIRAMRSDAITADIHCVTKWSKFDTSWTGVPVSYIWDQVAVQPAATHVMVNAYQGYTANLPIQDFIREGNLFAHSYEGVDLDAEHGFPLRLVVPHLYFWKSVKWVTGFTLIEGDEPGFWERGGYHMYGDPFKEQRYSGD